MRILVIDDERAILRVIERLLSRSGEHEIMTAESASDAFFLLANFRGTFGVILCDVHMAGMDGPEFLARLSPLDAARVVFMTGGLHREGDEERLAGRRIVMKPIDAAKLEAAIGTL